MHTVVRMNTVWLRHHKPNGCSGVLRLTLEGNTQHDPGSFRVRLPAGLESGHESYLYCLRAARYRRLDTGANEYLESAEKRKFLDFLYTRQARRHV